MSGKEFPNRSFQFRVFSRRTFGPLFIQPARYRTFAALTIIPHKLAVIGPHLVVFAIGVFHLEGLMDRLPFSSVFGCEVPQGGPHHP